MSMIIGIIIGIYQFRLVVKSGNIIITKRCPTIVIMICLASINLLLLEILWQIFTALSLMDTIILSRIWHALFSLSMPLFTLLIILRFWLIYYDLCWANFNSHSQWICHINQAVMDNNFWLKYRHKWGNVAYCKQFMFKVYIIISTISLVSYQIGLCEHKTNKFHGTYAIMAGLNVLFLNVFPLVFCIILFCKSPGFEDHLFIQYEFRINIIILSIALLSFMLWIAMIACPVLLTRRRAQLIASVILRIPETISFTSTFLVLYKAKTKINNPTCSTSKDEKQIESILADYAEFQKFMKYLMGEFAMESALALLEFVQFKYFMKQHANTDGDIEFVLNEKEFPRSYLVYQSQSVYDDILLRCINIAILLHDKYIAYGSILEINISYGSREYFIFEIEKLRERVRSNDTFVDMDIGKLFTFFDDVIHEMILLLGPPYYRFNHVDDA